MILDRSQAPPFNVPEKINIIPPIERRLRNGIPLYFIPSPEIEAIKIEMIFPIDHNIVPIDKTLVPFFMLHMLLEGTKTMRSEELDDFFDFHASEVEIMSGYESHGLGLLTTRKHFKSVLPVFRSLFTEAVFPEKELNKRKSQKKLSIAIQKEQTASRGNQLVRKMLFGEGHPFGYNVEEADIETIEKPDLLNFYQNHFLISPEIFVTGLLDEEALSEIEKDFNDLPYDTSLSQVKVFNTRVEKRISEIKPEALQSSIRLGKVLNKKPHPDNHGLVVFNTFLGGYFGSRLIKNIREEKGYTYGINSFMGSLKSNEYWMVLADVKAGFAESVFDEIYREIGRLSSELIPDDELEIVRNFMIGHLLAKFSSPFDLMNHFKKVHFHGMDYGFYQDQLQYIKNFDKREMVEIGEKYFQRDSIKEILVGAE